MRAAWLRSICSVSLIAASAASAVPIDWVPIGNPGNAADGTVMTCCGNSTNTSGYGDVAYSYFISKYEVTNAQYAEFLNAKAASDPLSLYNASMASSAQGGITRSGATGSFTYALKSGYANKPAVFVSFFDALRFANWLANGQENGSTETGSYTLLGGTATPSNAATVTRNAGATAFLPPSRT